MFIVTIRKLIKIKWLRRRANGEWKLIKLTSSNSKYKQIASTLLMIGPAKATSTPCFSKGERSSSGSTLPNGKSTRGDAEVLKTFAAMICPSSWKKIERKYNNAPQQLHKMIIVLFVFINDLNNNCSNDQMINGNVINQV